MFAAAAGAVVHEEGDGVAGDGAVQGAEDGAAAGDGGAEVGGALGGVGVVEVVGFDAVEDEVFEEGAEGWFVVVDVAEEDGLGAEGEAGVEEETEGFLGLGSEFVGVGEVEAQPEGAVGAEDADEGWGDAHGEGGGDFGADTEEADVGDSAEGGEEGR